MSRTSGGELAEKRPTEGLVGGKYELVRLIGRGGMGSVWEAKHATLGTRVAIKFVDAERAQNEDARRRFENEARAAATIESKHAIKVHDHGFLDDKRPYIVMELLSGEPLDRRLDHRGRLPLADTARIVQHVARALQQAHDSGITHRDLKPDNIFLCRGADDDDEIAKVLDFGIAKIVDPETDVAASSSTRTGVLMGTPSYMSPEQARGLKTVDFRSDLWAVGVIVFRCVTGVLPFRGEALGDLLVKICASPIPVPSAVLPTLGADFDAWMAKALDREQDGRFQTAREMADSLAVVAGIPLRSTSHTSGDSITPPVVSTTDKTILATTPPTQKSPGVTPAPEGPGSTTDVQSRPVAMITSSPLTTSSHPPPPRSRGPSVMVMSLLAGLGLFAAAGVTTAVMTRTSQVTAPAANLVNEVAMPLPSVAPAPAAPPPVVDPPVPDPVASAAPSARPPSPTSHLPVHAAAVQAGKPAAPPAKHAAPPAAPPPVSLPKAPPSLPGSDPGY